MLVTAIFAVVTQAHTRFPFVINPLAAGIASCHLVDLPRLE